MQVLYDYQPSLRLYVAWMGYFRQLLTVSTVSLVCSAYLIVAWTLERFLSTGPLRSQRVKGEEGRGRKVQCTRGA